MNVDRTRFLLLTTALSAAAAAAAVVTGCTVTSTDKATSTPAVDSGNGGTDSGGDAYYTDGGDAGACLTDDGIEPTCAAASTSCSTICQHYIPTYKKGVARAITDCIMALPTCEGAEAEISNCVQVALGKACADPSATSYCTPIVEGCLGDGGADGGSAALDLGLCTDLATGLNVEGRGVFNKCVTSGTPGYCQADPTSCIETIE